MGSRAVFLDRDGVINPMVHHPEFGIVDSPGNAAEFSLLAGAGEAIARFNRLGLLVVVVSNQPGIAKKRFTVSQLDAMTNKMIRLVRRAGGKIDATYYCCHHPDAALPLYRKACQCRKPSPGMLLTAARKMSLDLGSCYMVGDGVSDILAGRAAGSTTLFVSSRKCYVCDDLERHNAQPDFLVRDLLSATDVIERLEKGNARSLEKFSSVKCAIGQVR